MSSCCSSAIPPEVRLLGDGSNVSCEATMAKLLDNQPCLAEKLPFKDVRSLITDLQVRQEELFRQLIDQQKEIQSHLLGTHSNSKEELVKSIAEQVVQQLRSAEIKFSPRSDSSKSAEIVEVRSSPTPEGNAVKSGAEHEKANLCNDKIKQYVPAAQPERPSKASNGTQRRSMLATPSINPRGNIEGKGCTAFASRLMRKKEFELTIALFIAMNSLVLCFETQYQGLAVGKDLEYPGRVKSARDVWPGAKTTFNVLDWVFGLFFTAEMIVKIACWHHKYFYDWKNVDLAAAKCKPLSALRGLQGWNWLDFSCVVIFFADKLMTSSAVNPQLFRLLRLFRLWRLVRLLRFLETVDHLYIMTTAIASLGKVLAWAVLLLATMLLACDLMLVQILQVTYFDKVVASDLTEDQLDKHQKIYQYFGTCTRGMLSMFEITMGNWPPIARMLSEEVSEWFTLFCLIHKLTIGFAVIGVITGVILQETFKVAQTDDVIMLRNKKQASSMLRKKMKTLFQALDQDGDGKLEEKEFESIGDYPEIECWLASLEIETDDLRTLFTLIDDNGNGYVTLDELIERMPRIKGTARGIDMLAMRNKLGI
mmetsp:Transcript_9919/g.18084  ORF Transcript_9919/g.18084 Transcript_9919/m.18084 type:complete len:594 (+) Transcript_9919:22-1803(+)